MVGCLSIIDVETTISALEGVLRLRSYISRFRDQLSFGSMPKTSPWREMFKDEEAQSVTSGIAQSNEARPSSGRGGHQWVLQLR